FSQRMDVLQLRRRERYRTHALVFHDLIGRAEFLEQPEDALRARIVEMVNLDHDVLPGGLTLEEQVSAAHAIPRRNHNVLNLQDRGSSATGGTKSSSKMRWG